jgi:hypothetical protein
MNIHAVISPHETSGMVFCKSSPAVVMDCLLLHVERTWTGINVLEPPGASG